VVPTTVDSSTIGMLRTSYSSIAWARSAALAFAGTYEGGGNSLTEHVPLGDNTNGGNKYATFIRDYRLWDKDEFFIQVVP